MWDSIVDWFVMMLYKAVLFLEGILFQLVSYSYKLFSLMCQLNFNSLYALISPLIDRLQAVIIVLVVYKLAMGLIDMMIKPESAPKVGTDLIKNIFITVICLLLYNLVFSVLNEVSMLILGSPPGYSYTVLNELAGVTGGDADEGLIMRFVFGETTDIGEIGDFIAFETMSISLRNTTDTPEVENALYDGDDGYNFMNMHTLASKIGKTVSYFPIIGMLIAMFLTYTFFNLSAEIGIRIFKLIILQMIAPLPIVTIIKDGWNSSMFKKFCSTYFSIYKDIFIRVLVTLVVTVFVSKFVVNIKDFFAGVDLGDEWYTSGLLLLIIIFAGYKFVLDAPKLIDSIFGTNVAGSKGDGFSSVVGGALAGGVAGMIGGAAAGGGFFSRAGGALAGGLAGMTGGAANGFKGQSIVDAVKNSTKNSNTRTAGWRDRGGFGNVTRGAINDVTGQTRRQDKNMNKYQAQMEAVEAYDKAQIEAIKDGKMDPSDIIRYNGTTASAASVYSDGYENVQFGDSADSYAQRMLEYDRAYQTAQAQYTAKQNDPTASASDIATAQRDLLKARNEANARAKEQWNYRKDHATGTKVDEARHAANKKLGRDKNATIDISATKKEINNNQKKIQEKKGYQATHQQKKDK